MATAMAQAPGDRRIKWEDVKVAIDNVQAIEAKLDEAHSVLNSLMQGMSGEDGPNIFHVNNMKGVKAAQPMSPPPQKAPERRTRGGTKKEFVEQMFFKDNNASFQQIKDAWEDEGHDDTISSSLVYKIKRTLSESGQIEADRRRGRPTTSGVTTKREPGRSTVQPRTNRVLNDLEDTQRAIRDLAYEILGREKNKQGLLLAEIVEIMEKEDMVPELPEDQDIGHILSEEMKFLRETGKISRGDNKVLRRIQRADRD